MTVTIHDIARIAGVNASTVSRALRGDARVKPDTIRRIRDIAIEHEYVPNRNARSLIAGRTGTVWLVLSTLDSDLERAVAGFLADAMRHYGYELLIALSGDAGEHLPAILDRLRQRTADGAILIPPCGESFELCRGELSKLSTPVVCLDRWFDGAPAIVANDNAGAVEQLARHCVEAGAEHFLLAFFGNNTVSQERKAAACRYLDARNLPYTTEIEQLSALPAQTLGVLADSEHHILLSMQRSEILSRVKGHLRGGFFDRVDPLVRHYYIDRTVCIQDFAAMARAAAEMLAQRIQGGTHPAEFRRIPFSAVKEA